MSYFTKELSLFHTLKILALLHLLSKTRLSRSRCHNSSWFHAGTTESPDVGIEVSPSLENGSSPTPTPLSVLLKALTDSQWCDAMSSELTALMHHNTWQLVPPPNDCNIVGCKWVFQIKRHPDGSVDRFKARLVAKGFNQRPRLDYKETFSPIVKTGHNTHCLNSCYYARLVSNAIRCH
ncbi:putative mitochondrial protein [Vitis vinifera]|uniref:Putative mitochondrial protein n=1 Tax=Vitis vinifera TaxID=29760 RepID=A0A438D7X4_VITVI|nr:putative mitochondrial protein [Vitis vinifera]